MSRKYNGDEFEDFLSSIGEELELSEKQQNYQMLHKFEETPIIREFITEATTDEELVEYIVENEDPIYEDLKSQISNLMKKIGAGIKRAFKQVFPFSIYSIGVGIGKGAKNLYGFFDAAGRIILNPILKSMTIDTEKKTLHGLMDSKKTGREWNLHISGFGMGNGAVVGMGKKKNDPNNIIFYYATSKNMPKPSQPLNAGKRLITNNKAIKKLFEAAGFEGGGFDLDDAIGDDMISVGADIESETMDEKEIENINKNLSNIASNVVGYKEYANMIKEAIENLEASQKGKPTQIAVYGDSGIGKTQIVEQMAKYSKANYFYVQLDKLDQSLLKGIGVLKSKKEKTETGGEEDKTYVEMAGSDLFPTDRDDDASGKEKKKDNVEQLADDMAEKYSDGDGVNIEYRGSKRWIIFFDEFNRAPEEATTIVMNILNTGAIVSAITKIHDEARDKLRLASTKGVMAKLPENSLIMLAMNTASQANVSGNIQQVGQLDVATVSRLATGVTLETNLKTFRNNFAMLPFWYEFKGGDREVVFPRLPNIVNNYMDSIYKEALQQTGDEEQAQRAPFNQLRSFGGGEAQAAMDPRSWTTAVADKIINKAKKQWDKMSDEEKQKYSSGAKKLQQQAEKIVKKLREQQKKDYENLLIADPSLDQLEKLFNKDLSGEEGWKNLLFSAYLNSPERQKSWANKIDVAGGFGDEAGKHIQNMIDTYSERLGTIIKPKDMLTGFIHHKQKNTSTYDKMVDKHFGEGGVGRSADIASQIREALTTFSGKSKIKTAQNILEYITEEKNYTLSTEAKKYIDKLEKEMKEGGDKKEINRLALMGSIQHIKDVFKEMYNTMPKETASETLGAIASEMRELSADNPFVKELHEHLKEWNPYRATTVEKTETMAKSEYGEKKSKEEE